MLTCCGSKIYKVRELASQIYASLSIGENGTEKHFSNLISNVAVILQQAINITTTNGRVHDHNKLHGYILKVSQIKVSVSWHYDFSQIVNIAIRFPNFQFKFTDKEYDRPVTRYR